MESLEKTIGSLAAPPKIEAVRTERFERYASSLK